MKMTFIGATHEVTGSCTYIEACGKHFLVDFGMEQGAEIFEKAVVPVPPNKIDFVLLTHAHIDHSGMLPLLYAGGFQGEIHATVPTANLCEIMLRDSAHIQEFEAEWRNRKGKRKGDEEFKPLYVMADAIGAISCFIHHKYEKWYSLHDGIEIRFTDAGHLLGAASIEIKITEDGETRKIVFSGDIGNSGQPLIRNPGYIQEADYAVIESTYGTRIHDRPTDYVTALAEILKRTFDRGGSVIIPSFAVGRTQELLYFFRQIKTDGLVDGHEDFPVYIDSPLAIEATNIFLRNRYWLQDAEAAEFIRNGINPIGFDGLITAVSELESREIKNDNRPKVIISASGMCEAGRIKHHLKHNIWKKENTVLFVGYQALNTAGRAILEGADKIKLFGEMIYIAAEIATLPGISGHADVNGLIKWISAIKPPKTVFVNHGDADTVEDFAGRLRDEFGLNTYAPYSGASFDLLTGEIINDAKPVYLIRKPQQDISPIYGDLVRASERLGKLIKTSSGRPNKELKDLTKKIMELCNKWE